MPPSNNAFQLAGQYLCLAHSLLGVMRVAVHPVVGAPTPPVGFLADYALEATKRRPPHHTPLQLTISLCSIAALVLLGGVFAGLTLGLMGLDIVNLRVLSTSGRPSEQKHARIVLNLLEKGRHWVLVVLLLGNVIVNETLPVFLSDFGGGLTAVLTSTILIVIFGEILPQSICARHGLAIGALCAPLVNALVYLFAPVAWPTAKLLDWCLGEEQGTVYRKAELKAFVSLHQAVGTDALTEDQVSIIRAVLDLNDKKAEDVMTSIDQVYSLSTEDKLDAAGIAQLAQNGYSRIPVHEPGERDTILGMLLVKNLISYDPDDAEPVSSFQLTPLPEASTKLTLFDCLNYFQQGRSHMLLISDQPGEPRSARGVVTLEDVIEELIGREIEDEFDEPQQVTSKDKDWPPLLRGIIERRWKHVPSLYGLPAGKERPIPKMPRSATNQISDLSGPGSYGSLGQRELNSPLGSPFPNSSMPGSRCGTPKVLVGTPKLRAAEAMMRSQMTTPKSSRQGTPKARPFEEVPSVPFSVLRLTAPDPPSTELQTASGPADSETSLESKPNESLVSAVASTPLLSSPTSGKTLVPLLESPKSDKESHAPLTSQPTSVKMKAPGALPLMNAQAASTDTSVPDLVCATHACHHEGHQEARNLLLPNPSTPHQVS